MTRWFHSCRPGTLQSHLQRMPLGAIGLAIAISLAGARGADAQVVPPTVTTAAGTLNGATGFDAGGEVTDDGGEVVSAAGVCWSITGAPTIADSKTADGSGSGAFVSPITGLSEDTLYYFRAYATNSAGTGYGQLRMIITGNSVDISNYTWTAVLSNQTWGLAVGSMDQRTMFSGMLGGLVSVSFDFGASWADAGLPVDAWFRGAASADARYVLAGADAGFSTPGGRLYLSSDGGQTWAEQQLIGDADDNWDAIAMSADGTHQVAAARDSDHVFISHDAGTSWVDVGLTGASAAGAGMSSDGYTILLAGKNSQGKAYISRDGGTTWAERQPAGTSEVDWVAAACSSDGEKMYLAYGDAVWASADAGAHWTECNLGNSPGIAYYAISCTADGRHVVCPALFAGFFMSGDSGQTWTELQPGGIAHGSWTGASLSSDGTRLMVSGDSYPVYLGTASATPPTVTTAAASNIASSSASGGGDVTANGGATVRARGVCWNTGGSPSIADSHTVENAASGPFTSNLTGLSASTTYYVRAYATNSAGTSYGSEESFTTAAAPAGATLPTVTTAAVTILNWYSAQAGGSVTADGGSAVTARGVCWNKTGSPNVVEGHTSDGVGVGDFTSSITGLVASTTYHLRAYVTNATGTGYGDEVVFTTAVHEGGPVLGVTLARSDDGEIVPVGGQAEFVLTLSNTGNEYATQVALTIPIPSGTEFVSASVLREASGATTPISITNTAGQTVIRLLAVAPASSVRIGMVLRLLTAGDFNLQVAASSAELPQTATTSTPTTLKSEDVYTVVTRRHQLPHLCGLWGIFPWCMTTLGLLLMRGRRWR
jgi:uncharacterized repeat protein (TIGR01451 family)